MDAIIKPTRIPTQPPITLDDYTAAVRLLLPLAMGDTSGSRAAAGVLLSAYNANCFHLCITDLCLLCGEHYAAAIIVIRGRAELRIEPHERIPDGDKQFEKLWTLWACLNNERYGR